MQLLIDPRGSVRCMYAETIDLAELGRLTLNRGSYVEPNPDGHWFADLSPVNGPRLGPYPRRSEALQAEALWLETHWLMREFSQ